jgi:hypothetical protein
MRSTRNKFKRWLLAGATTLTALAVVGGGFALASPANAIELANPVACGKDMFGDREFLQITYIVNTGSSTMCVNGEGEAAYSFSNVSAIWSGNNRARIYYTDRHFGDVKEMTFLVSIERVAILPPLPGNYIKFRVSNFSDTQFDSVCVRTQCLEKRSPGASELVDINNEPVMCTIRHGSHHATVEIDTRIYKECVADNPDWDRGYWQIRGKKADGTSDILWEGRKYQE